MLVKSLALETVFCISDRNFSGGVFGDQQPLRGDSGVRFASSLWECSHTAAACTLLTRASFLVEPLGLPSTGGSMRGREVWTNRIAKKILCSFPFLSPLWAGTARDRGWDEAARALHH